MGTSLIYNPMSPSLPEYLFRLVMAIRRIFGPDSDFGFLKESVKKSGGLLADSGYLFLADSGFGFRILAVFLKAFLKKLKN